MKKISKIVPALVAASIIVAGSNALANQFTGSIAFGASGVTIDNPDLADATSFAVTGAFTTTESGIYSTLGVTAFHPVEFNGFTFNPPVSSVDPLWLFNIGMTVFSFEATSVSSTWVPGSGGAVGEWVITGAGVASITDYDNTDGTYTVNLSQSGDLTLGFDSTASVAASPSVPDGGASVTLMGVGLTGLAFTRKFYC